MTKASLSRYLLSLWINVAGGSINRWATFPAGQTPPTLDSVGGRRVVPELSWGQGEWAWSIAASKPPICGHHDTRIAISAWKKAEKIRSLWIHKATHLVLKHFSCGSFPFWEIKK